MGLINFNEIDFTQSIKKENTIINFNGNEIQIVPYLSAHDKYDFITITLQKAFDNGIYNDLKLQMYFDLNLIYMYTNVVFSREDRVDEELLYDTLKTSGFIDIVKEHINEKDELWSLLKMTEVKMYDYKSSFLTFIIEAISNLPNKAQQAVETLQQIDPALLQSFSNGPLSTIMTGIMGVGANN